ncbi:MAG: hypothetical protein KDK36_03790 [Leptospiraceae bacterium]|nr:hypothetical protein [Leptospiraceae bacterium]
MKTKFATGMTILGFVLSIICGFVVGNRIIHILTVSIVSAAAMGLVGVGVYTILEKKVPEFIEFLNNFGAGGISGDFDDDVEGVELSDENSEGRTTELSQEGMEGTEAPIPASHQNDAKFGDHIMIDNIAIKNEPKLMAEAIRTFMAMDDSQASPPPTK